MSAPTAIRGPARAATRPSAEPVLILHVGLPKTGTTFLQHRVFRHMPNAHFVHRTMGGEALDLARDFRTYARIDPVRAALLRRRIRSRLNLLAEDDRPVLVTEENISISPTRFWHGAGATPAGLAQRIAALARGLDSRLLPVKLIVGIRRQDQWLASRYAESSKDFPDFGQADFERRMKAICAGETLDGPLAWLDYAPMRAALADVLGDAHVHVVSLEELIARPYKSTRAIEDFLGGPPLFDPDRKRPAMREPRNQLATGQDSWGLRRDGATLTLAPGIKARLRQRFEAANRALPAHLGLDF